MTFLVSSSPLISGAFAVRAYPGFGILGADIPTEGDNGASPVANDIGIVADGEYYWRRETSPSDGTLTLYPDLTFEFDAPNGAYSWMYRVGDSSGLSETTGTVYSTFGATDGAATGALSSITVVPPSASANGISVYSGSATGAVSGVICLAPTGFGGVPPFTQAELEFLIAYMQENLMIPTAEQIAAAVLSALNATAIPVDVTKINHVTLTGAGTPANPMRPM